jgi:hypothetical protein
VPPVSTFRSHPGSRQTAGREVTLRGQVLGHLVLEGLAKVAHQILLAELEHRALRCRHAATHDDEQQVIHHVRLRLYWAKTPEVLLHRHERV